MALRDRDSRAAKVLLLMTPALALRLIFVVIFGGARRAAHVVVLAREMTRACKFRCSLQDPHLILQANFGASG
jgi:hypothetical protein